MKKLLTICVSWQRPKLCKKMIKSFYKTTKLADLFIYVCDDDPYIEAYKVMLKEFPDIQFEVGPHLYIAEVSNYASSKFYYEYYQMINDDHEFIGVDWDKEMVDGLDEYGGWKLASSYMPEELMVSKTDDFIPLNAPNTEIFSRKIIDALGFYNFPGLKQYGCDKYITELGEGIGGIIPFSGKILHNCWHGLKRMKKDATTEFVYSDANMAQGEAMLSVWTFNKNEVIRRVLEAKKKDGY